MTEDARERRISSWGELFERSVELGLGAAILTAESAQKLVNDMVARGQVTKEDSTSLVDRLMSMGREQRDMLSEMMEKTSERVMNRMNMARQDEVAELRRRIDELERIVLGKTTTEGPPPPPPTEDKDFEVDQE